MHDFLEWTSRIYTILGIIHKNYKMLYRKPRIVEKTRE